MPFLDERRRARITRESIGGHLRDAVGIVAGRPCIESGLRRLPCRMDGVQRRLGVHAGVEANEMLEPFAGCVIGVRHAAQYHGPIVGEARWVVLGALARLRAGHANMRSRADETYDPFAEVDAVANEHRLVMPTEDVKILARDAIRDGRHRWIGDDDRFHNALVPVDWFFPSGAPARSLQRPLFDADQMAA